MCGGCAAAVFSVRLPLIYNKKKIKDIEPPTLSDERDSPAAATFGVKNFFVLFFAKTLDR